MQFPVSSLTCKDHPHLQTLLEAAVLAAVPLHLVDLTLPVCHARVHPLVLHRALEETLAPARHQPSLFSHMAQSLSPGYLFLDTTVSKPQSSVDLFTVQTKQSP